MEDQVVLQKFTELLQAMRARKTPDRLERDRYIAIATTDVEKAMAVYVTFVAKSTTPEVVPFVNWNS